MKYYKQYDSELDITYILRKKSNKKYEFWHNSWNEWMRTHNTLGKKIMNEEEKFLFFFENPEASK